jgi:hypothetical protein
MILFINCSSQGEWLLDRKDWDARHSFTSVTWRNSPQVSSYRNRRCVPRTVGRRVMWPNCVSYHATTLLSNVGHRSLLLGAQKGPRTSAERTIRTETQEWAPASECTAISLQREVLYHICSWHVSTEIRAGLRFSQSVRVLRASSSREEGGGFVGAVCVAGFVSDVFCIWILTLLCLHYQSGTTRR